MNDSKQTALNSPLTAKPNASIPRPVIVRSISCSDSEKSMAAIEEEKNAILNEKQTPSATMQGNKMLNKKVSLSSLDDSSQGPSCSDSDNKKSPIHLEHATSSASTASSESSIAKPPEEIRPFTRAEHRDFVAAIMEIGVKHCSPMAIIELLRNEGQHTITREIMKSHLQKYRKIQERGNISFLTDYDSFLRTLEKCKAENEADSSPSTSNNKKLETANKSKGADQQGESAIKKALLGKRPMNLVGGEAVSLVSFAVANDCDENFLSSLNSNKLVIPVLTEEEKNSKLGRAITSIAGLLMFTKDQLKKSRSKSQTDVVRIQQLVEIMAGQVLRQQRQQLQKLLQATHNNHIANDASFPARRMSCPETSHNTNTTIQQVAGAKRRHSTMSQPSVPSNNFSQGSHPYQPTSTEFHPQFYGNPNMPPSGNMMMYGYPPPHDYQHHHHNDEHHHRHPSMMMQGAVHPSSYYPPQWEPQHLPPMQPPVSPPVSQYAHWPYHHHHHHQQQQQCPPPVSVPNGAGSYISHMDQQHHLAKMHQHQAYSNTNHSVGPDTMTSPYKVKSDQFVEARVEASNTTKSPSVYDYISDLDDDPNFLSPLPVTKRRKTNMLDTACQAACKTIQEEPTWEQQANKMAIVMAPREFAPDDAFSPSQISRMRQMEW